MNNTGYRSNSSRKIGPGSFACISLTLTPLCTNAANSPRNGTDTLPFMICRSLISAVAIQSDCFSVVPSVSDIFGIHIHHLFCARQIYLLFMPYCDISKNSSKCHDMAPAADTKSSACTYNDSSALSYNLICWRIIVDFPTPFCPRMPIRRFDRIMKRSDITDRSQIKPDSICLQQCIHVSCFVSGN